MLKLVMTYPWSILLGAVRHHRRHLVRNADDLVFLDESNLRHETDLVHGLLAEVTGVALDMAVVNVAETDSKLVAEKRVLIVCHVDKIEMVGHELVGDTILEEDHVRVVHGTMGMMGVDERRNGKDGTLLLDAVGVGRERRRLYKGHKDDGGDDGEIGVGSGSHCGQRRTRGGKSVTVERADQRLRSGR